MKHQLQSSNRTDCKSAQFASISQSLNHFLMLALLANNSSFKRSLHQNATALLKTIAALLGNATGLMNTLLEAGKISKWLASSLLIVEAILAYAKDKLAYKIELFRPAADDLDKKEDDENADIPMPDSVAPPGPPALINKPSQAGASLSASTSAPKFLTQKHSVSEAFLNSGVSAILLRNFSCKTSSRGGLPYAAMLPCHTVESTPVKQAMIMATDITLFISLNGRIRQSHLPSNLTLKIPSGETAGSDMQIDEILPTDPERPLNDAPW
ncbi:hypothetical protein H4Q26_009762 [Puccinia striiformis f. sp. tritici PST-130]|uniref:Uncharacterized protein n=1 Tax=Puccinia striiformis f. sp. tritici PST-78 TaxID=1165861 RepID=A0A0L0V2Q8_9BASI|nr:hypothetical protein H4Q26_009762 [Puccinia striiformis f. sp. tritici PST-130]KNE93590.1 hypothetical protein PSTG_13039 [Puccinia striiformis f. sp. tritici PST-78]